MQKPAIALFARAPLAGRVKTRLIGSLGAGEACDLHRALVADTWNVLGALEGERFLYTDQDHKEWRELAGPRLRLQQGADLGERLWRCFSELQAAGFGPLLIVGSDTVGLTPELVSPWTKLLEGTGAVLGPAEDGGYWAIGCRAPDRRMLDGVEWSCSHTLAQTVAAMERCGMVVLFLDPGYDVDTPEDLARLETEPRLGVRVRAWLDKLEG